MQEDNIITQMANSIRMLSVLGVEQAKSGHPGMPLGCADLATILFKDFLVFNPNDPLWLNRDRFVLSVGHGCMLLYALLHSVGYAEVTLDSLKNFRQINSITSGHPEFDKKAGIEITTGPLGHGVANAVGMAIAEKILNKKYKGLINHYTYVLVGDGCLMEGISYEALALAGHLNMNKLIVIWDNNSITIDGSTSLSTSEDQCLRFKACGFNVMEIDGHNQQEISTALQKAKTSDAPIFIAAKTKIAFGTPTQEGKSSAHGTPLGRAEIEGLKKNLKWIAKDWEIPKKVQIEWEKTKEKNQRYYTKWQETLQKSKFKNELLNFMYEEPNSSKVLEELAILATQVIKDKSEVATRVSSNAVLNILNAYLPNLIGGAADLSKSINTLTKNSKAIQNEDFEGNYINYGIREHGMGAIMNGLAAYGGFKPYGGTFLVFSDFLRPAIRLACLMRLGVIYIFTHDSIAVGEDGPTHEPVEQLPSLRLIPNLLVIRPADTIETIEAYLIALASTTTPVALIFSRQNLPLVRSDFNFQGNNSTTNNVTANNTAINKQTSNKGFSNTVFSNTIFSDKTTTNKTARGGYILQETDASTINLIASGSEVQLALEVAAELARHQIKSRVISMPSLTLFHIQDSAYKEEVLGFNRKNIVIEAANSLDYLAYLGGDTKLFGVHAFGKSGKAQAVYDYFNLNVESIAKEIREILK